MFSVNHIIAVKANCFNYIISNKLQKPKKNALQPTILWIIYFSFINIIPEIAKIITEIAAAMFVVNKGFK